jgi:hypothetical protein
MSSTLTRFGRRCREARSKSGKCMAEQADVFNCPVSAISDVETGKVIPTTEYVEKFSNWLRLCNQDKNELLIRIPRSANVIEFPIRAPDGSKSIRLFRKVSKMTPQQIRKIPSPLPRGAPDD